MRISLLLEREPFAQILERTLADFWSDRYGLDFQVRWNPTTRENTVKASQWWCNYYLNAIFPPSLERSGLEPIRREFSRSLVAWRRPIQQVYVNLALSGSMASWLKQAELRAWPHVADHDTQLIVAGNHRIRVLDHQAKRVFVIAKHGADSSFLRNEVRSRAAAESAGVQVPSLIDSHVEDGWFAEEYIAGTPINRLADEALRKQHACAADRQMQRFWESARKSTDVIHYTNAMYDRIKDYVHTNACLSVQQRQQIVEVSTHLLRDTVSISAECPRLDTTQSHGDYQAANILADNEKTQIIDWEYAARRQFDYDRLVFELDARTPRGLVERIAKYCQAARPGDKLPRNMQCGLFLLEELERHLKENANQQFRQVGRGLLDLITEMAAWCQT